VIGPRRHGDARPRGGPSLDPGSVAILDPAGVRSIGETAHTFRTVRAESFLHPRQRAARMKSATREHSASIVWRRACSRPA
jgi:hypothetical protein